MENKSNTSETTRDQTNKGPSTQKKNLRICDNMTELNSKQIWQKNIVREFEQPRLDDSDSQSHQNIADSQLADQKENYAASGLSKFCVLTKRFLYLFVLQAILAIFVLMYYCSIFDPNGALFKALGHAYNMLKQQGAQLKVYMPIIILMVLAHIFFVCFMIPGLTLFQLIAMHFISKAWLGYTLLAVPMLLVVILLTQIVKNEVKDWAVNKFENEHICRLIEKHAEKRSKLTSLMIWLSFMPLGKKIYIMTVLNIKNKITNQELYLPAILSIPLQAAILLLIGHYVPDFRYDFVNEFFKMKIEIRILLIACCAILTINKLLYYIYVFVRQTIRLYRFLKTGEDCDDCSNCAEDSNTVDDLDMSLDYVSNTKRIPEFEKNNNLEISLDSIVVQKLKKKTDAMSCINKEY